MQVGDKGEIAPDLHRVGYRDSVAGGRSLTSPEPSIEEHLTLLTGNCLSHMGAPCFLLWWFCTGFLPFFPQIQHLHLNTHTHTHPRKMLFSPLLNQVIQITLLSHQGQLNCVSSELEQIWTVFAEITSALEMLYVRYQIPAQKSLNIKLK